MVLETSARNAKPRVVHNRSGCCQPIQDYFGRHRSVFVVFIVWITTAPECEATRMLHRRCIPVNFAKPSPLQRRSGVGRAVHKVRILCGKSTEYRDIVVTAASRAIAIFLSAHVQANECASAS